ncbi:MAG: hypothetical protein AAF517_08125 [Planctomycetota bacterium]
MSIRKISGTEAVLESGQPFQSDQFIYTTVELKDGPSLALSGVISSNASGGVLVQWNHSSNEADRVDRVLGEYKHHLDETKIAAARSSDPGLGSDEATSSPDGPPTARIVLGGDGVRVRKPKADAAPSAASTERAATEPTATESPSAQSDVKPAPADSRAEATPTQSKAQSAPASEAPSVTGQAKQKKVPTKQAKAAAAHAARAVKKKTASKAPPQRPTEKSRIVVNDGKVDVDASIRNRARRIKAKELANRVETVQVLTMSMIKDMIRDSVNEAVALLGPTLGDAERKKILEEAESGFQEQVREFEAAKKGLQSKSKYLEDQLSKTQSLLDEEKEKIVRADQFTVSDAGLLELEQRFSRLIDRAIREEKVSDGLTEDMRNVVAALLDDEREKITQQARRAQSDKVALLQQKVERLANNLEQTSVERDRAQKRAQALEASGGMPLKNVVDAGLDEDDPDKERKLSLLKEIVSFNREVRDALKARAAENVTGEANSSDEAKSAPEINDASTTEAPAGEETPSESKDVPPSTPSAAESTEKEQEEVEDQPTSESAEDDRDESDETDPSDAELPQIAEGEGVNPDDMLWEPPSTETNTTPGAIRSLG